MPKTTKARILFSIFMAFVMVYFMIVYNISLETGGLTNQVFRYALHEIIIMWPVAVILELSFVGLLARRIAFKIVKPTDRPIAITLAISISIVCIMCPLMSLIATLLFNNMESGFIATYITKTVLNFPMAIGLQLFIVGPLVRSIFILFSKKDRQTT